MEIETKLPHLERVLIVCGLRDAGKSTLLRSMFVDPRLGTSGVIPASPRIPAVALSRERCLQVRCTSPHESDETLDDFLQELERARRAAFKHFWRFNYACAMQPLTKNRAPDVVEFCDAITKRLMPERIRLVQVNPRQDNAAGTLLSSNHIDRLRSLDVEVIAVDGRRGNSKHPYPNGYALADYFDFT